MKVYAFFWGGYRDLSIKESRFNLFLYEVWLVVIDFPQAKILWERSENLFTFKAIFNRQIFFFSDFEDFLKQPTIGGLEEGCYVQDISSC